ncbi:MULTISPECIES: acetate--CoA ligase family protein [unclassified Rhodococcus (in: high G+C Gram-positive bacteria)]|uniref:acetate--CoA ligase family protein n=1 Tax=unclassified Rhodococcus (in: high G+C Gram-positive bacteria) TaxID=192944 RepID=UPI001639F8E4|nr:MULTISPECIES: acetate--CoA ligase family protein [unclassified Rhodococcus (in: high G+C Gram-positive bacteria)]MBC2637666.1 acetate--CoA ligase family protein [Rhodococcus sp. 3A]MBC2897590.1 acetate--CoA ligase family protein [Rhodococcus sp. 4CII]
MTLTSHDGSSCTAESAAPPASSLGRVLNPGTIAVVGLSDKSPVAPFIEPTLDSGADVYFVHPSAPTVLGRPTYRSVSEIPVPVDAVLSVMSAERTVSLAEECAALDCGGLVVYAAGFSELGVAGDALQRRLVAAAERGSMAVVGPNSLGYISVPRSLALTASANYRPPAGGVSIVSHSGAMIGGVAITARLRTGVGISRLISAGNEAVTDIADYVDFLAGDPETTAVGLIVEGIRRPEAFLRAARRCIEAGKPVVALKLARNSRTQQMAASHTGALAGNAWAYDVAFHHAGIQSAHDIEELVDRLSIVDQLHPANWNTVERLGVVAGTGGFASLAYDLAEAEGLSLPPLDELADWVAATIPGIAVPNPLDTTGFGATFWTEIVDRYVGSPDLDAVVFVNMWGEGDDSPVYRRLIDDVATAARRFGKPVAIAAGAGPVGSYAQEVIGTDGSVALGYGLRGTLRGLQTMGAFVRDRARSPHPAERVPEIARPTTPLADAGGGRRLLPFDQAMKLLQQFDIPIAPYCVIRAGEQASPTFPGHYAVKLADVAHRTELGAVTLNVAYDELDRAVDDMRALASRNGVRDAVAIQPMTPSQGELLVGVEGRSELGPMVMLGIGGVLVEVLERVGGRPAPMTTIDAEALIEEFHDLRLMHGYRGAQPWHLSQLAQVLVGFGRLAAACHGWIESLDVNPLLVTDDGLVAVDALCIVRDAPVGSDLR